MNDECYASLVLNYFVSAKPKLYTDILNRRGSAVAAVRMGPEVMAGGSTKAWEEALRFADAESELLKKTDIQLVLHQSDAYPLLLRQLFDVPPIIYVRGQTPGPMELAVAIVGSRHCSYYGETMARVLTADLVAMGLVTVSGLARGIDSYVHEETIQNGGRTWAVLGCGLGTIYPPENKKLADKISENGALLSEFPYQTKPRPPFFPKRNRIIAGLSAGTIVVEGDEKSGSLITARLAAEEGREVFAVPGPVTSRLSRGPHRLILEGAKLIQSAEDVLKEITALASFQMREKIETSSTPDSKEVVKLFEILGGTAVAKEVLFQKMQIGAPEFSALLFNLETDGRVRALPGGLIQKINTKNLMPLKKERIVLQ